MAGSVRIHETGDASVLRYESIEVGDPEAGQVRLKQTAIGLNFIDVYFRTGIYPPPVLPFTPGLEAAGVIDAIGENVDDLSIGDRVAYAAPPLGAYADERLMPADRLVKIPSSISDDQAAAVLLKGLTAQYLLRRTFKVEPGQTILFHAAAGGVGLIACQWAKSLGVTVIGTVGSADKAELAKAHGCTHIIRYDQEDLVTRVKEITDGQGVPVVYDSVGQDTFEQSLDCLAPLGMLVSFGQSSGKVPPFDIATLSAKGSLFMTRPTLMTYTAKRSDLVAGADELFAMIHNDQIKVEINQRFPLSAAQDAHRALEARETTGSTLLIPSAS